LPKNLLSENALDLDAQSKGVMISGGANIAMQNFNGTQISGGLNYANKMKGVQIGVVNIAKQMDGYTFGLINIVGDGVMDVSLSYNELDFTMLGFKSGSQKSFSQWSFGKHKDLEIYNIGLGLGLIHHIGEKISIENSLNAVSYFEFEDCTFCKDLEGYESINDDHTANYQLKASFEVAQYFKPYVAVTYNKLMPSDDEHLEVFNDLPDLIESTKSTWVGFSAGVDF